jgi:hypothetical protein
VYLQEMFALLSIMSPAYFRLTVSTLVYRHYKEFINELTPWSRVLLVKLIAANLVKKFPTFYGTRNFIAVFKTDRH